MRQLFQFLSVWVVLVGLTNITNAQTSDTVRVLQLEEQVRHLNGQIEELNFQMLQMQKQMQKMREDYEFRFEELEERVEAKEKQGGTRLGKSQPSDSNNADETPAIASDGKSPSISDLIEREEPGEKQKRFIDGVEIFDPEKDLNFDSLDKSDNSSGTIIFGGDGKLTDNNNAGKPIQLVPGADVPNSLLPDNPDELFDLGYQYIQAGKYERSAEAFEEFSNRYPDDRRIADAQFWLGESLFSLSRYDDAARIFLDNHKQFPNSRLAAQNLLKLGISLAGLNQRELACATYADVPVKYPDISNSIRSRIEAEQRSAKCKG